MNVRFTDKPNRSWTMDCSSGSGSDCPLLCSGRHELLDCSMGFRPPSAPWAVSSYIRLDMHYWLRSIYRRCRSCSTLCCDFHHLFGSICCCWAASGLVAFQQSPIWKTYDCFGNSNYDLQLLGNFSTICKSKKRPFLPPTWFSTAIEANRLHPVVPYKGRAPIHDGLRRVYWAARLRNLHLWLHVALPQPHEQEAQGRKRGSQDRRHVRRGDQCSR